MILGVDPGFTGALALYDYREGILKMVVDMPLVVRTNESAGNKIDIPALAMLVECMPVHSIKFAIIEEVGSRPKEGVASVFKFGFGAGALSGIIAANGIPIFYSMPGVWKMLMGVTHDKDTSLKKARDLFGPCEGSFSRKKDHGRAEAALMAWFAADRLVGKVKI